MSDIFKFLTKDNLLYLVSWIYLKVRFLLECLLLILAKSLLNSLADLVIFPTTENSDVSRVSNFALDAKSSDKSFIYIYIRENNGPSTGAPASIAAHEESCPFRTTLFFR